MEKRTIIIIGLILLAVFMLQEKKEATTTITNNGFESSTGWQVKSYKGEYSTEWSSEGQRSYKVYREGGAFLGAYRYICVYQEIGILDEQINSIDFNFNPFNSEGIEYSVNFWNADMTQAGTFPISPSSGQKSINIHEYIPGMNAQPYPVLSFCMVAESSGTDTEERGFYVDDIMFNGNCISDCSCASDTCIGDTCSDGCGGNCQGTKVCYSQFESYKSDYLSDSQVSFSTFIEQANNWVSA